MWARWNSRIQEEIVLHRFTRSLSLTPRNGNTTRKQTHNTEERGRVFHMHTNRDNLNIGATALVSVDREHANRVVVGCVWGFFF